MRTYPTLKSTVFAAAAAVAFLFAGLAVGAPQNAKAKPYPLEICLVTSNELGSMGKPYKIVHEGQEVKFCCKPCVKKFNADPEKYLTQLKS
ncbi:MAG: YHS domain-containing protein [Verrucomicrobiales bacterium]|jgi:YHS domain-containing protein